MLKNLNDLSDYALNEVRDEIIKLRSKIWNWNMIDDTDGIKTPLYEALSKADIQIAKILMARKKEE